MWRLKVAQGLRGEIQQEKKVDRNRFGEEKGFPVCKEAVRE